MSGAAVEPPCAGMSALLQEAERLAARLPGYRVEIIGGELTVTPRPDGPHGEALTELLFALAPLRRGATRLIQGIGIRLPDGPDDYAVPDLSVVDATTGSTRPAPTATTRPSSAWSSTSPRPTTATT